MKMSKHTSGPWFTDEADHDCPNQNIRIKRRAHTICTVFIDDAPVHDFNATQRANARLIAAAPDLLDALEDAIADREGYSMHDWLDKARAAFAKATGETK
jgi:hypothetical protein